MYAPGADVRQQWCRSRAIIDSSMENLEDTLDAIKRESITMVRKRRMKIFGIIISIIFTGGIITVIVFLSIYLYKKYRSKDNKAST